MQRGDQHVAKDIEGYEVAPKGSVEWKGLAIQKG